MGVWGVHTVSVCLHVSVCVCEGSAPFGHSEEASMSVAYMYMYVYIIPYIVNYSALSHCHTSLSHTPSQHSDSDQLSPLRERERELREELLQSQRENMTLRFDYEQAVLELPRLRVSVVM